MNKGVEAYKLFRQLEERERRANPYKFYDKDELIDEILKLEDKVEELMELYTTERHCKDDYKAIIKEVREYMTLNIRVKLNEEFGETMQYKTIYEILDKENI